MRFIDRIQTVYIPDLETVGKARGVYTLTSDITALREAERRMADLALHDALTGLANRRRFDERLPEALARGRRLGSGTALMFLDIDHFKRINDTFGHAAGDGVLVEFGKRLKQSVRSTDFVARLAGDEFVVILEGLHERAECESIAEKVVRAARPLMSVENEDLSVTSSLGLAFLPPNQLCDAERLLKQADEALYRTKRAGRDGFTVVDVLTNTYATTSFGDAL